MYRYVGFIWDMTDGGAAEFANTQSQIYLSDARQWSCLVRGNGIILIGATSDAGPFRYYSIGDREGAVLGRLFRSGATSSQSRNIEALSTHDADSIFRTAGRQLVDDFWGCYVAILKRKHENTCSIIRDCSGKVPCFTLRHRSCDIVFSDIQDILTIDIPSLTVDWKFINAFLANDSMRTRETAFAEVTEVLAGECLTIEGRQRRQFSLWDPTKVFARGIITDPEDAAERLYAITQNSIDAWASLQRRIVHTLSGGLDSAIVLGCLTRSNSSTQVTCVNRFGTSVDEDERRFARDAAATAGVYLEEIPFNANNTHITESILDAPIICRPTVTGFCYLDIPVKNAIASRCNAEVTWTGQGGDHLFFNANTNLVAADCALDFRFSPRTIQGIRNTAFLTNECYWSVLLEVLRSTFGLRTKRPNAIAKNMFINDGTRAEARERLYSHPWTAINSDDLPPGKFFQICGLSDLVNRHLPYAALELAEEQHPLISQPLIELCIQIPTYLLTINGEARGLAKKAFSALLPKSIVERRTKGSATHYFMNLLHNSSEFLNDILTGGELATRELIAPDTLMPLIAGQRPIRTEEYFPLYACIAAEIWLRQVSSIQARKKTRQCA